ncbi:PTS sugar transporter subunit IIA [Enterococcus cecorum]|uniref:PTS sugar transporter subunit IIA n=1 Tax=Enterococcus cecorum TaxID=44008 RepID=UPI003F8EBD52
MKMILASHGKLATGMKDTIEMIVGKNENIYAFAAYSDGSETKFLEDIRALINENQEEQIVIATDLLGGSVNNEMIQLLKQYPQVYLISGMNLPVIITLATAVLPLTPAMIEEAISMGKEGVVYVNQLMKENNEEEDLL